LPDNECPTELNCAYAKPALLSDKQHYVCSYNTLFMVKNAEERKFCFYLITLFTIFLPTFQPTMSLILRAVAYKLGIMMYCCLQGCPSSHPSLYRCFSALLAFQKLTPAYHDTSLLYLTVNSTHTAIGLLDFLSEGVELIT